MTNSLEKTIYQYRADWFGYLAASMDDGKAPLKYVPAMKRLEEWNEPATGPMECVEALTLALEAYAVGESNIIPAMIKATIGWLIKESSERAALLSDQPSKKSSQNRIAPSDGWISVGHAMKSALASVIAENEAGIADPLFDVVQAARDEIRTFDTTPTSQDEEIEAARSAKLEAALEAVADFEGPGLTRAGAMAALRFAREEVENYDSATTVPPMLDAAIEYFEGSNASV